MVLGEVPITSYFAPIPKSRKRAKASTSFVPTKKQRPNEKRNDPSRKPPRTPPSNPIDLTDDTPEKPSCSTARSAESTRIRGRRMAPPIDLTADSPKSKAKCKARFLTPRENDNGSEIVDDIPPSPTRCTIPSPPPSADEQFDDFVPSSQTQYLLPIEPDAETDFIPSSQSQYFAPEQDDDGFVVPSCQSQSREEKGSPEEEFVPTSQSQVELELQPRFGPPDLEINMAEIFEQPPLDSVVATQDGSQTESDSEDDVPAIPPEPRPALVRSPSPSQDAFSLSGSMPEDLKIFYEMVGGGGEGSFPDSFPQSLKWMEREDTPE